MLPRAPFYYLRHGETDWNREGRLQGWTDIPLNATGKGQARAAQTAFHGAVIKNVCASPLLRARETADIVNDRIGAPLLEIDDLREVGFGEWEGSPTLSKDLASRWRAGLVPDGGESYESFSQRVLGGLSQALAVPGPVLIVAHGAVLRVTLRFLGVENFGPLANAEPLRFTPGTGTESWSMERM